MTSAAILIPPQCLVAMFCATIERYRSETALLLDVNGMCQTQYIYNINITSIQHTLKSDHIRT